MAKLKENHFPSSFDRNVTGSILEKIDPVAFNSFVKSYMQDHKEIDIVILLQMYFKENINSCPYMAFVAYSTHFDHRFR